MDSPGESPKAAINTPGQDPSDKKDDASASQAVQNSLAMIQRLKQFSQSIGSVATSMVDPSTPYSSASAQVQVMGYTPAEEQAASTSTPLGRPQNPRIGISPFHSGASGVQLLSVTPRASNGALNVSLSRSGLLDTPKQGVKWSSPRKSSKRQRPRSSRKQVDAKLQSVMKEVVKLDVSRHTPSPVEKTGTMPIVFDGESSKKPPGKLPREHDRLAPLRDISNRVAAQKRAAKTLREPLNSRRGQVVSKEATRRSAGDVRKVRQDGPKPKFKVFNDSETRKKRTTKKPSTSHEGISRTSLGAALKWAPKATYV